MDNIQFWIYIAFAVIYFISKSLKQSKKKEAEEKRNFSPLETEEDAPKPVSFEDLLEEITGRKTLNQPQAKPNWEMEQEAVAKRGGSQDVRAFEKEGSERKFSDEESKKVYEESIKLASRYASYSEPQVDHMTKWKKLASVQNNNSHGIADEIREMLADANGAKKAIILSEILNRKY